MGKDEIVWKGDTKIVWKGDTKIVLKSNTKIIFPDNNKMINGGKMFFEIVSTSTSKVCLMVLISQFTGKRSEILSISTTFLMRYGVIKVLMPVKFYFQSLSLNLT